MAPFESYRVRLYERIQCWTPWLVSIVGQLSIYTRFLNHNLNFKKLLGSLHTYTEKKIYICDQEYAFSWSQIYIYLWQIYIYLWQIYIYSWQIYINKYIFVKNIYIFVTNIYICHEYINICHKYIYICDKSFLKCICYKYIYICDKYIYIRSKYIKKKFFFRVRSMPK